MENAFRVPIARKFPDDNGAPDILERGIYRVGQQLNNNRLMRTGDNDANARFRNQILSRFGQPFVVEFCRALRGRSQSAQNRAQSRILSGIGNFSGERIGECRNLTRGAAQPMIRHRASDREPILGDVEPVHCVFRRFHAASLRERARGSEIAFAAIEKVAVEREHDVRALESRDQSHVFTKADAGRVILRFAQGRVVNAPHHFRKRLL